MGPCENEFQVPADLHAENPRPHVTTGEYRILSDFLPEKVQLRVARLQSFIINEEKGEALNDTHYQDNDAEPRALLSGHAQVTSSIICGLRLNFLRTAPDGFRSRSPLQTAFKSILCATRSKFFQDKKWLQAERQRRKNGKMRSRVHLLARAQMGNRKKGNGDMEDLFPK